jgi:excinuclease UvrABC nuclease subunit
LLLDGFTDITPILRCGVYALCKRGVVIYVGKSKSIYARVYTHRHFANRAAKGKAIPDWLPVKGIQFDEVHIRPCTLEALDRLEAEMIDRYRPRYNQSMKNNLAPRAPFPLTIGGTTITLNESPPRPQVERRV